jgi:hypothetical protein
MPAARRRPEGFWLNRQDATNAKLIQIKKVGRKEIFNSCFRAFLIMTRWPWRLGGLN